MKLRKLEKKIYNNWVEAMRKDYKVVRDKNGDLKFQLKGTTNELSKCAAANYLCVWDCLNSLERVEKKSRSG